MLRSRDFWFGVGAALIGLYVYHHMTGGSLPGKAPAGTTAQGE